MAILFGAFFLIGLALVCGFALGAAREFLLTPHLAPAWATAIELPCMLRPWAGLGWQASP